MHWKDKEKKAERRKQLLIGGIIAFVMIASIIGFAVTNTSDEVQNRVKYKDYVFYRTESGWVTTIANTRFGFRSIPLDLENITMPNLIIPSKVYLTTDSSEMINGDYSLSRLAGILQYKGINVQRACIDPGCGLDVPLVKCSEQKSIIYIKYGNFTGLHQDGNCLAIEAENNDDLDKLTERVVYFLLGVM